MDCFASLAMTWSSRHAFTASPRMRPSLWLNPSCALLRPSLRANGSRERAPDDRLREAIHLATVRKNGLLRCARNDEESAYDFGLAAHAPEPLAQPILRAAETVIASQRVARTRAR